MKILPIIAVGVFAVAGSCEGMLFWNLDNSANQSDPGTGAPWGSVATVSNSAGTLRSGSAVYLGDGYLLTANHVTMNTTYGFVTFNGVDFFEIDSTFKSGSRSAGKQVDAGLDLAVFKLTTIPGGIPAATLLSTGTEEVASATIVGWGVGRDAADPLASNVVTWGAESTSAKRWGQNVPLDAVNISYDSYSYTALRSVAGGTGPSYDPEGVGNSEAAVTLLDSGSGLFQSISGSWYLIGLTTTVDQQAGGNTSTFGNDKVTGTGNGDGNYFVRISAYDDKILALVPEPATGALLGAAGCAFLLILRRKRRTYPPGS